MDIASTVGKIPTLINLIVGIVSGFTAILLLRVTWPIVNALLNVWDAGMAKWVFQLIMWLIYFFVCFMVVITKFTKPQEQRESEQSWR